MKEYFIKSKDKECFPFDEWITSLEMRAFGWADKKHRTDWLDEYDITIDWENSPFRNKAQGWTSNGGSRLHNGVFSVDRLYNKRRNTCALCGIQVGKTV